METKLLLVDVDCGSDDAQAIMMALAAPNVRILGITCCFGNTHIENVCKNVLHVLNVCNRKEIPVFRGASASLLGDPVPSFLHFGEDGLGDVLDSGDVELSLLQKEHAAAALIRIASEHARQVSLVATGPLTNLALAVKLDPSFSQKLKSLYIMGGNMRGQGNRTVCAEFNFALDPEAAYIVMKEYTCPTYIATLEYTHDNKLPWEFFIEWVNQDSEKARFMKKITANYKSRISGFFVSYDAYAMAAAIDESVVKEYIECAVSVEIGGKYARGLLVLDPLNMLAKQHKIFIMKECHIEKFKNLLWLALK